MKKVKCKLEEFRGSKYLVLFEKQRVRVGDWMLCPNAILFQEVIGIGNHYNTTDICYTRQTIAGYSANNRTILAATKPEIKAKDWERLLQENTCYVFEENRKIVAENGFVKIEFEGSSLPHVN